jgi:hypothetical protein
MTAVPWGVPARQVDDVEVGRDHPVPPPVDDPAEAASAGELRRDP